MKRRFSKSSKELQSLSLDEDSASNKTKERETFDAIVVELSELFKKEEAQDTRIDQIANFFESDPSKVTEKKLTLNRRLY